MDIGVVTLFPGMFSALSEYGITGRAVRNKLLQLRYWNPRDYATDRHRTVDDRPYGGGPGMVMRTGPVSDAIIAARAAIGGLGIRDSSDKDGGREASRKSGGDSYDRVSVIYLSPQGKPLDQRTISRLAQRKNMVLLCGRYEGVDERVLATQVDEEYSLGDFILSGGELAAMALVDAMTRLLPGALGDAESALQDSFSDSLGRNRVEAESAQAGTDGWSPGLLDHPHYTRPENYAGIQVPPVLLSGDHAAIDRWRLQQRLGVTWRKRPDLLEGLQLTEEQKKLLEDYRLEVFKKDPGK